MVHLVVFYFTLYILEVLVLTVCFLDIFVVLPITLVIGITYRFFSGSVKLFKLILIIK